MDNQSLYLKTNPLKLFIKVAIPCGTSMLVSSLYSVFDAVFVGKYIGATAFAAIGLASHLLLLTLLGRI